MPVAVEPNEGKLQACGLQFHYVEWGDPATTPMILLHGLSSTCRIWDPVAQFFLDRYHMFAPDQRGHANTTWPAEPDYRTADFVGDLEEMVEEWGTDRFVLVGLSMGGMNAIAYAAKHPERVTHLVSVDIPPYIDRERNQTQRQIDQAIAEHGHPTFDSHEQALRVARLTNQVTSDDALLHRLRHTLKPVDDGKWTYKHDPRAGYHWSPSDLWGEIETLTAPVLLVRGGKTNVFSERTAERMRETIPDAELVTLAEAGHTVPADRPEDFARVLQDFLSRRESVSEVRPNPS